MNREIKKHFQGCYRISGNALFAQIKKYGGGWQVEIRKRESGEITRYAGYWNTKREAVEEAERVLDCEELIISRTLASLKREHEFGLL